MDIADWIIEQAGRAPDKAALHCAPQTWSYAELAARIESITAALAGAGAAPGDRVAWLGVNSAAMVATLFACARLGAIFTPLNWRLAPPEHHAMLRECEPSLLCAERNFVDAGLAAAVQPLGTRCVVLDDADAAVGNAATPPGWTPWSDFLAAARGAPPAVRSDALAPVLLCFTSGSTGRPKGVLLSGAALAANADASVDMHGLTADDRILTTLPLFHVGGLNILTTPALRAGCSVTLHARFDADATFDAIEQQRITLTVLVPAQLEAMIAHPRWAAADLSSLRMLSTGSTLVPERLIHAVHARGLPLVQVWGATETAPIAACLHADEAVRHAGAAGRAALGCALRVVEVDGRDAVTGRCGEILVRSPSLMSGYWRDAGATANALAGGWYRSGDSGHLDDEGFLTIDGRLKDMIISGGENVSPAEVESVLLSCSEVGEAAVVGRPDARWGEAVVAVVAPAAGAALTRERVLALFDGRLARFKQPKHVLFVDALPRTALGKVRKEDVRRLVAERLAASQGSDELPREQTA